MHIMMFCEQVGLVYQLARISTAGLPTSAPCIGTGPTGPGGTRARGGPIARARAMGRRTTAPFNTMLGYQPQWHITGPTTIAQTRPPWPINAFAMYYAGIMPQWHITGAAMAPNKTAMANQCFCNVSLTNARIAQNKQKQHVDTQMA